jgi:broad specificity phosphatase PhoE
MSRVYLIRHAKPASVWGGGDDDPGLDETGQAQALKARDALLALPEGERPTKVVSSPLRRCLETAQPFADAIGAQIEIDAAVGEVPTPRHVQTEGRGEWLRKAFEGLWSEIEGDLDYEEWRREVHDAVGERRNTAVFSHFVAINAVLSRLAGDDRVITYRPDHASITVLEVGADGLSLVSRGPEAATQVL